MGNIRFKASKKTLVILFLILFLILGGSGGYLLWRVNQSKTVAPTDSSAGSDQVDNCCCDLRTNTECRGVRKCEYDCETEMSCVEPGRCGNSTKTCRMTPGKSCTSDAECCRETGCIERSICKPSGVCAHNNALDCVVDEDCCISWGCTKPDTCELKPVSTCNNNPTKSCITDDDCCMEFRKVCKAGAPKILKNGPKCTCTNTPGCCHGVGQCKCTSGSQCPPCKWPLVAFCRSATGCTCIRYDQDDDFPWKERCDDTKPCLSCPPGYGESYVADNCQPGEEKVSGSCTCLPCNNPYTATICCKKQTQAPKCGDQKVNREGEECDPPGSACPNNQTCTDECKCPAPPNTCDGVGSYRGGIVLSTITPEHCKPVTFDYTVGDTDGVGKVTVKLNGTDIAFTEKVIGKTKKITGTIPGDKNCDTNKRTLTISWVDIHGTGGSLCTKSVEYTPKAKPPPQDTTCDPSKAGWVNDPKGGKFETCKAPVEYSYKVADPQGVDLSSIVVTLNGQKITHSKVEPNTGTPTVATVSGKLNTTTACLPPGSKIIKIVWKDKNGNPKGAEKPCTAQTTFTIEAKNTCDAIGAGWKDKVAPPNEIVEGKGIVAHYIAADKDGVGSIEVLFDNAPLTSISKVLSEDGTKVTITITIPRDKLTVGNHTLQISWKDKLGIGGEKPCKVVHNIVVKERPVPDWDIEKVAKEKCIDDGTENPISKITNTITIKNEGNGSGTIAGVVDTLDTKVVGSTLSGITEGGVYGNGKITWSRFQLPAGGTKVLTYSYTVAKDKFDIYKNSVIATVEGGGTLDAGATIEARCNVVNPSCGDGNLDTSLGEQCDPPGSTCTNAYGESSVCTDSCTCPGEPPSIPETGIFDDSRKVVVMGAVLLFTGIGWTWLSSTYKLVNGKLVQRRKENFEQRLVKR